MKNNLENKFKELFKEFEVPYETGAWEAMNSKLKTPAPKSPLSSLKIKLGIAALFVGVIGFGIYKSFENPKSNNSIILSENKESSETKKQPTSTDTKTQEESSLPNSLPTEEIEISDNQKLKNNNANKQHVAETTIHSEQKNQQDFSKENAEELVKILKENQGEQVESSIIETNFIKNKTTFGLGLISSNTVCSGENITIENPADSEKIVRFSYNEKVWTLSPGESYLLTAKNSEEIQFINDVNEVLGTSKITVHTLPTADFILEANIFENGLPVIQSEAFGDAANFEWTINNKEVIRGNNLNYYSFEKGNYDITLKATNKEGCENSISKTINVNERYNLMAVDAFMPNGTDSRNRTFMPFSLTEREVKFELNIIDPLNNEVVFSSNDTNNSWNGINQRTGKMTPSGKSYIWKVRIFNPLPNERPVYTGTIVHN